MSDFIIDFLAGLFLFCVGFRVGILYVDHKLKEAVSILEKILDRNDDELRRFQEQARK